ncbi:ribosomal protein S18 acetylase RimI-like enzyme [Rhizobium leguminosarum]|uniref:Ribosomal protein S18 acetylase RimI-like enzyme n=1 Tax=Rhizobium leguminosarum TaxID=384 RepID=A0AAE2MIH8_RHILE|nr:MULTISPECIES: GNAT family N-acetyltransferase [Rhizobium]MBB4289807.1 ribosomal protein S18 acetylase RimI-like enzyme [Rhizobium leguminosarum]MBB4296450.1 ribosomal protein S18 acetylase RimI-like enzyme [Rhizobium leguminosarum]MBB4308289.1 ribosomal protein S18 acetylase RimI-like enzyme [Rhizobium leguminosarum]MBB4416126.1 ribosomal protein S18 acetylase RimI-like enzyme [Rhizobium leguminosarum]MBB4430908.1 ribosomal protein S18 acetylase RimI-like enzyme [Rhizobium esperanzae]
MDAGGATIRLIQVDEVEVFRRIRLEALRAEPSSFASRYEDWEVLPDEEWANRLNEPVFIAFQDGAPVGIMGLFRQRPSKMVHRATIVMVYVRANLRGTGLAGKLLEVVSDHARGIGVRQLELFVSAENPAAIRFYQRQGFAEIGRIPGGVLEEGREIDDVMMARRLSG